MKKRLIFTAILFTAVIIGCNVNLKDAPKEKCTDMPNENVMKAIYENCINCHNKDFKIKEDVCMLKGDIIEMVRTKKMPKFKTLSAADYKTIVEWK